MKFGLGIFFDKKSQKLRFNKKYENTVFLRCRKEKKMSLQKKIWNFSSLKKKIPTFFFFGIFFFPC